MKKPYFKFYPGDWLSDQRIAMLTNEEEAIYLRFLCYAHQSDRPGYLMTNGIPMDLKILEKISRNYSKKFRKIFEKFLNLKLIIFDEFCGAYYNPRMVKDAELSEVRAESGRHGGNPNLVKQNESKGLSKTVVYNQKPDLNPNGFSERPPLKTAGAEKTLSQSRGSRLPADWSPSAELAAWVQAERPDLDIATESASFVDYWVSKPGKDGVKLNWDATFRNWVRRARPAAAKYGGQQRLHYSRQPIQPATERIQGSGQL